MNFARCLSLCKSRWHHPLVIQMSNLDWRSSLEFCPPTPVWNRGVRVLGRAVEFLLLQINRAPPKIVPSPRVKLLLKHTPRTAPSSPLEIENRTSNWKPNWNWAWNWELNVKQEQCPFGCWWMQCTTSHLNATQTPSAKCHIKNHSTLTEQLRTGWLIPTLGFAYL